MIQNTEGNLMVNYKPSFDLEPDNKSDSVLKASLATPAAVAGVGNVAQTAVQLTARQEAMLLKYKELKLRRNLEQVQQLKMVLAQDRIYTSTRSLKIIEFTQMTEDYLIPSIWGVSPIDENPFKEHAMKVKNRKGKVLKVEKDGGCCVIM